MLNSKQMPSERGIQQNAKTILQRMDRVCIETASFGDW